MTKTHVSQLTRSERVKLAKKSTGLMARVARKCKVSHAMVSHVLHGRNVSERVLKVLYTELNKELLKTELLRAHLAAEEPVKAEARVA